MKEINASRMSAPAVPCRTCPFEGTDPIRLTEERRLEIFSQVSNFSGSHLCHSARDQQLCRGGRNLQIKIAYATGLIGEATDEAFQAQLEAVNKS